MSKGDSQIPSAPNGVAEIKAIRESGDPALSFKRLREHAAPKLIACGMAGVACTEALAGNTLFTPSAGAYSVVATGLALSYQFVDKRREPKRIAVANEKQERFKAALGEPVDLFGKGRKLTLRWYALDPVLSTPEEADIPDRLQHIIEFAKTNKIRKISVAERILDFVPAKVREEFEEHTDNQFLDSPKRKIKDGYTWNPVLTLSPAELSKLATYVKIPENMEKVKNVTRLHILIEQLMKAEGGANHPLVEAYAVWHKKGDPEDISIFTDVLQKLIQTHFSGEEPQGFSKNTWVTGSKRGTQATESALLKGDMLHIFESKEDVEGNRHGSSKSVNLLASTGYESFDELWEDLVAKKTTISPQDYVRFAEVAAWYLFLDGTYQEALRTQLQKVPPTDAKTHNQTYFTRLAESRGSIGSIRGVNVEKKGSFLRRMVSPLATMAVGATIALQFAAGYASDAESIASKSNHASIESAGHTIESIDKTDRELNVVLKSLVKRAKDKVSSSDDNEKPAPEPLKPENANAGRIDPSLTGVGDFPSNSPTVWLTAQAGPNASTNGYWSTTIQNEVQRNVGDSQYATPPFSKTGLVFIANQSIPEKNTPIPQDDVNKLIRTGNYIFVTGELGALEFKPYGKTNLSNTNLSVKEGAVPRAAFVEVMDKSGQLRPDLSFIPQIVRTPQNTYELVTSSKVINQAERYGVQMRLKYWLDTHPSQPTHSRAVEPMFNHEKMKRLHDLLSDQQADRIVKALGLAANRPYTPQEIAAQIRRTKVYSRTPYATYFQQDRGPSAFYQGSTDSTSPAYEFTEMATTAAELPAAICNNATLIDLMGSKGGNAHEFVNVSVGFNEDGDGRLTSEELHSHLVTNFGQDVDPTPNRPDTSGTLVKKDKKTIENDNFHQAATALKEKSLPAGVTVLGLISLIGAVRIVRRLPGQTVRATQQVVEERAKVRTARLETKLFPDKNTGEGEEQTKALHQAVSILQHLLFAPAGSNYHPKNVAPTASLSARYHALGPVTHNHIKGLLNAHTGLQLPPETKKQVLQLAKTLEAKGYPLDKN